MEELIHNQNTQIQKIINYIDIDNIEDLMKKYDFDNNENNNNENNNNEYNNSNSNSNSNSNFDQEFFNDDDNKFFGDIIEDKDAVQPIDNVIKTEIIKVNDDGTTEQISVSNMDDVKKAIPYKCEYRMIFCISKIFFSILSHGSI